MKKLFLILFFIPYLLNAQSITAKSKGTPALLTINSGTKGLVAGGLDPGISKISTFFFSATSKTCAGNNNVFGDPHTGVRSATDAVTGIGINTVATNRWIEPGGTAAFDNLGVQNGTFLIGCNGTVNALMYSSYVDTMHYNHALNQLEVTGLDPAKTYEFKITGSSQNGVATARTTQITIEGLFLLSPVTYDPHPGASGAGGANVSGGVTVTGIIPDALGKARIWVNETVGVSTQQCIMGTVSIRNEN